MDTKGTEPCVPFLELTVCIDTEEPIKYARMCSNIVQLSLSHFVLVISNKDAILDKSPWDNTATFLFFCYFSVPS